MLKVFGQTSMAAKQYFNWNNTAKEREHSSEKRHC